MGWGGGGGVGILVHKFRISHNLTNGVRDKTLPLGNPLLHCHKGAHSISGSGTCVVSNILFCDFLTSTLTGHMPYEYFTLAFFLSVFFSCFTRDWESRRDWAATKNGKLLIKSGRFAAVYCNDNVVFILPDRTMHIPLTSSCLLVVKAV